MPRKLVAPEAGRIIWMQYEEPPLRPGQVRIRCRHASAKHGTEVAFFKGHAHDRGPFDEEWGIHRKPTDGAKSAIKPFLGNMAVGEVIEAGPDVGTLKVGQRIAYFAEFQETHVQPESACRPMPEGMDWRSAVCLDPATFALSAIRDGHVRAGDDVAVFGLGAIGLMVVQMLRMAGAASIIAFDPLPGRRALAAEFGATLALDPTTCDAGLEIRKATGKRGADVVIEYSGSVHAMQAALRGVAFGGNVVAAAFPAPYPAGLDLGAEAHINRPNLIFSRACSNPDRDHPRWSEKRIIDTCWRWLCEGKLDGRRIVQPIIPFDRLAEEYPKIATDPQHYLKLGVDLA